MFKNKQTAQTQAVTWSLAVIIAGILQIGTMAAAGDLVVNGTASHLSGFGLQVTDGSSCGSSTHLVLDNVGTLTADQEGCDSITAGNNTIVSGTVTFTAGSHITFENGFSVNTGAGFTAALDENLSPFAWVQDDSSANETTFNVSFYVDVDNLTVGAVDEIDHFVAYWGSQPILRLILQSGPELVLEALDDSGSAQTTSAVSLSSGWNQVTMSWEAAASASASFSVNSGPVASVAGLDTDSIRISSVRWGAVGGTADTTSGNLYLDDFSSWR